MSCLSQHISYWLSKPSRWFHRRGFSVQSPWAFEFVTHVLFGKSRFYAFDELGGDRSDEQLFKVVRWLRPKEVVAYTDNALTETYLVSPLSKDPSLRGSTIVYYYGTDQFSRLDGDVDSGRFTDETCVIVDGIRRSNASNWQRLTVAPGATSAFDLGKRGIVFFDQRRQRQTYLL